MGFGSYMRDHFKGWFVWLSKLFFVSFIQTLIFFLIIFVLERSGLYMLRVHDWNEDIIYGGEVGAFFFGLILITDIVAETLRYFVTEKKKRRIT